MNSEKIGTIAKALSAAQGAMKPADMDNKGNYGKYASLASLWESCRAALSANGLAVVQQTDMHDGEIVLVTKLIHESGEWMGSVLPVKPVQATPQGMGSALTYARRYSLSALVGLSADDDDDGQAGSTGKASTPAQGRPQPAQPAQQPTTQSKAMPAPQRTTPPAPVTVTEPPNPFEDDEAGHNAISQTEPITANQLKALHGYGMKAYGSKDAWNAKRKEFVLMLTHGAHESAKFLSRAEADKLINGMKKKIGGSVSDDELVGLAEIAGYAPEPEELNDVPEMAH